MTRRRPISPTEVSWFAKRAAWRRPSKFPQTNLGWHAYYAQRFNKTENEDCAFLAMFYLFAALRDEEAT